VVAVDLDPAVVEVDDRGRVVVVVVPLDPSREAASLTSAWAWAMSFW
jgi:hypothetical protein